MIQKPKAIFFPNLDALRFFCFLSVFFFHSFATTNPGILSSELYNFLKGTLFANGNMGVNFFFVLSGFLITYLLLVEKRKHGKIALRKFYMRRVLRIWPLFYFCVFFGFILFPYFKELFGAQPNEKANPLLYLLFLNNLEMAREGLPDSSVLSILWSVAIEEQFYLFWPLIIGGLRTPFLPLAFVLIIIGSLVFRYQNSASEQALEFHTLSCISDMTVGGLGAYLSLYAPRFRLFLTRMPRILIAMVYAGVVGLFLFRQIIFHESLLLRAVDRFVVSVFFLMVILEQNFSRTSFFKLKSLVKCSKLGQYTYGLYCLHMIGILITVTLLSALKLNTQLWQVLILEGGGSLLLTLLLAFISYNYFEKRFLLLKKNFSVPVSVAEEEKPVSGSK